MKKIILGLVALTGACSIADANTLTINNNTSCTYNLSIGGGTSAPGPTVAAPGSSIFSSVPPSGNIFGVKIMFVDVTGATSQIYVGDTVPFANSSAFPAPACPTPFSFVTAIWQTTPGGDVIVTIL
jgi:hypothetical protein